MFKSFVAFLIIFVTTTTMTFAGSVRIKSFILELPAGYTGPINKSAELMEIVAFSKPNEDNETNSIIEFSIIHLDKAPPGDPIRLTSVTSKELLLKMLTGIERRRTDFWKENYKEIKLAGIPANKIEWSGSAQGIKMKGIYYTFIFEHGLYAISLQDVLPYADINLPLLQKAIEAMKKQ